MSKRSIAIGLIGLNVLLAAVWFLNASKPSPAFGQAPGRPGEILCVAARASGQTYDVVYVLDVTGRKLNALVPPNAQSRQVALADSRDLAKDFRR